MGEQDIKQTKLWNIIYPYDNWFNDNESEKNQEAKLALYDFYYELLNHKPSKEYINKNHHHFSYIMYLVKIKKAINQKLYQRACNELISLMHYEPFFQSGIYFNIIDLLEKELNVEGE